MNPLRSRSTHKTRAALLAGAVLLAGGGGGAAYLATRGGASAAPVEKVHVYYTAATVETGTAASTALAAGLIRPRAVPPDQRPAGAVTDATQLSGRVSSAAIPAGTVVTLDMFPDPQTRIGTVVIPEGKRALALELAPVAGVAGYAGAGDRVDIYGVVKSQGAATQGVKLVLQGVDVLKVNGAGLAATPGQPGGPNLVYLLAVTPSEAERLIYLSEFEKLYFDLIPKGEGPVATPGAGAGNALAV